MSKAIITHLARLAAALLGALWAIVEPTWPFLLICLAAKAGDVFTAVTRNQRILARYRRELTAHPDADHGKISGKLCSQHLSRLFHSVIVIFFLVILAHWVSRLCPSVTPFPLEQAAAAAFAAVQVLSVLENECCCNPEPFARVLRHYLIDKCKREYGVSIKQLEELKKILDGKDGEVSE